MSLNPQAVFSVLESATSMEDLETRLQALSIEVQWSTRGQPPEVYGWSLRPVGSDLWLKASSVNRQLSWPKVEAQLLANARRPTRVHAAHPAPTAEAVAPAEDEGELPAQAADFLPALPEITREEYEQPDIHILLKILKELGEIAARMAERIAALLRRFVNGILRKAEKSFALPDGRLGTLQDPPPRERPGLPGSGAQTSNEDQAIAQAVRELSQVVDAVKNDDPSLLPDVEGKDQLIKDLEWEHDNSRPGPQWPDVEDQPRGTTAERLAWFSQRAAVAQQRHADIVGKREIRTFNLPRFAPAKQEADRRVRRALATNKNHPISRALSAWRDAERRLKLLRAKSVPTGLLNAMARRRHEQELAALIAEEKEAKTVLDRLEAKFITSEVLTQEETRVLAEPERVAAAQELAAIDAEIRASASAAATAQADLAQAQTAAKFEEGLAKRQSAPAPTERNVTGIPTPAADRPRQ